MCRRQNRSVCVVQWWLASLDLWKHMGRSLRPGAEIQVMLMCSMSRYCVASVCPFLLNVTHLISAEDCSCGASNMSSYVVICIADCHGSRHVCVCITLSLLSYFLTFSTSWFLHEHQCLFISMCVCVSAPTPQPLLGRSPVPAVLIISVWRRLAQFSRNRGLVSFPHTHAHTHTQLTLIIEACYFASKSGRVRAHLNTIILKGPTKSGLFSLCVFIKSDLSH